MFSFSKSKLNIIIIISHSRPTAGHSPPYYPSTRIFVELSVTNLFHRHQVHPTMLMLNLYGFILQDLSYSCICARYRNIKLTINTEMHLKLDYHQNIL